MKFLILSDTHRHTENIMRAVKLNRDADAILFLGDGLSDIDSLSCNGITCWCVRGNCDGFSLFSKEDAPDELLHRFGEYNIMMMHGHLHGVKYGYTSAAEYAYSKGADILLFGHTHCPTEKYYPAGSTIGNTVTERPFRLFNPGSAGLGHPPTFGTLDITDKGIVFGHGEL